MTSASRGVFESAREADLLRALNMLCSEYSGRDKMAGRPTDEYAAGKELLRSMATIAVPQLCTFLERNFSTLEAQSVSQRDLLFIDAVVLNALADFIQQDPRAPQATRLSRQIKYAVSEHSSLRGLFHRELKTVTKVELTAMSRLKTLALGALTTPKPSSVLELLKGIGHRFLRAA
jgi:hypothetical protein